MDSLTTNPVAETLQRLFTEAETTDRHLLSEWTDKAESSSAVISELLDAEAKDYQGFYQQLSQHFLSVSPEFGRFLYVCARACGARSIVEFGTSFGVSTIHLAAAVRDNSGGRVISTELEPTKAARAHENLQAATMADLVDIRVGDALDTLRYDLDDTIDLVLLDGAFSLYRPVLDLLHPHLRSGALVIGENAFEEAGDYLDYVRNPENGYLSLPLPFDQQRHNELSLRTR
ncbi:methyltransferase [Streptomonospora alba]|uniref:Methyltransferase n=1 Tax=Streptomonospora alba TaxID=183763 RepID=A0A0C2JMI0_9ACTN|nr:class I SAM-dependent methyltransferase [Streptomonospora alba]KIH98072.1 methyltransferase [Streptomonospora alba]